MLHQAMDNMRSHLTGSFMRSFRIGVVILSLLCLSAVARADDRADVMQVAREYFSARLALDFNRIKECYEPVDANRQVQMTAEIKFMNAFQKVRNLAEEKFGPSPDPDGEDIDGALNDWDWGLPPMQLIDAELAKPDNVKVDGDNAEAWAFFPISLVKIDGRWLVKYKDPAIDLSIDQEAEAVVHRILKRAYDDLEAGKFDSVVAVRERISLLFGVFDGNDPSKVPQ